MKNLFKLRNVFLVLGLALMTYGCGKDDNHNNSSGAVAVTPGVCPAGQVWITQANACVAQAGCPMNQGWYNNVCTPGINQGGMNGYPYYGQGGAYGGGYGGTYGGYYGGGYGYNTQYYSPYQNNCYYKQKGIFYYYVCGY